MSERIPRPPSSLRNPEVRDIALVCGLALVTRLLVSVASEFSADEAFSYYVSRLPLSEIPLACLADRHPPLSYWLLHFLTQATSQVWLLRLPSVLMGVASVALIRQIALQLTRSRETARDSALLAAVMFSFWHYDIQTRMFALAMLGCLAGTWLFLRAILEDRSTLATWAGYVLAMATALSSLFLAGVVVAGHLVALLLLDRGNRLAWSSFLALALLGAPLVRLMSGQLGAGNTEVFAWSLTAYHSALLYPYYLGLVQAVQLAGLWRGLGTGDEGLCAFLTVGLLAWQAKVLLGLHRRDPRAARFLTACTLTFAVLLVIVPGFARALNLRDRYFFLLYPYLTILLACGLQTMAPAARRVLLGGLVGLNLALAASCAVTPYLTDYSVRPLAERVTRDARPGDVAIVLLDGTCTCLFEFYYARDSYRLVRYGDAIVSAEPHGPDYERQGLVAQYFVRSPEDLARFLDSGRVPGRAWLVTALKDRESDDRFRAASAVLNARFESTLEVDRQTAQGSYPDSRFLLFLLVRRPVPAR